MNVVECGYEVETQGESFAAIAVRACKDAKSLEPADDVFGHNSFACQLSVSLFLFG